MSKYKRPGKLGSGKNFKAIEAKAAASGARNPAAVAAAAGRKAHGQKAMTRYAQEGKARAARKADRGGKARSRSASRSRSGKFR